MCGLAVLDFGPFRRIKARVTAVQVVGDGEVAFDVKIMCHWVAIFNTISRKLAARYQKRFHTQELDAQGASNSLRCKQEM